MSREAIGALILEGQSIAKRLVARILRRYPEEVDDVLQKAALLAVKHSKDFRGESDFRTWFVRIAVNTAYMHLRYLAYAFRSNGKPIEDFRFTCDRSTPEQLIIQSERSKAVRAAIARLSRSRRRAAERWLCGEPTLNNAEKSARHHARLRLREYLRGL